MYVVKASNSTVERVFKINEETRNEALEYAKDTLIIDFDEDPKDYKWTARKQPKRKVNPKIQSKIEECKKHGFQVTIERSWLWLTGTDGRYNKKTIGKVPELEWEMELISKDDETKILLSLGFQYSSWRMAYYWDSRKAAL